MASLPTGSDHTAFAVAAELAVPRATMAHLAALACAYLIFGRLHAVACEYSVPPWTSLRPPGTGPSSLCLFGLFAHFGPMFKASAVARRSSSRLGRQKLWTTYPHAGRYRLGPKAIRLPCSRVTFADGFNFLWAGWRGDAGSYSSFRHESQHHGLDCSIDA